MSRQIGLFFIGFNDEGEFGLNHSNKVLQMTQCPNNSITKIYCGYSFNIFSDDTLSNLWSAGSNACGECGHQLTPAGLKQYTPIQYFRQNDITIEKIFVNVASSSPFFISDTDKVYACGKAVPIGKENGIPPNTYEPVHIPNLQNVIDIQSNDYFSVYHIALCANNDTNTLLIIQNWSRIHGIPHDIMNLLITFCKSSTVWATTNFAGTGHSKNAELEYKYGWNKVPFFDDKHIVKIAVGSAHTMFLDDTGVLWGCGFNGAYQIASEHSEIYEDDETGTGTLGKRVYEPVKVKYFVENGIKIKDIAVGYSYNLAVDTDGKVYSWGTNIYGQCGTCDDEYMNVPTLIEDLKEYEIDLIRCGHHHSYVKTSCDKHYLFGKNENGECSLEKLENDDSDDYVTRPLRVDKIILDKCNGISIVDVFPTYLCTKVIVSMNN